MYTCVCKVVVGRFGIHNLKCTVHRLIVLLPHQTPKHSAAARAGGGAGGGGGGLGRVPGAARRGQQGGGGGAATDGGGFWLGWLGFDGCCFLGGGGGCLVRAHNDKHTSTHTYIHTYIYLHPPKKQLSDQLVKKQASLDSLACEKYALAARLAAAEQRAGAFEAQGPWVWGVWCGVGGGFSFFSFF